MADLTIGEAKEYYNKIINEFENIGYDVCSQVMNSKNYGVSQTRTRVIFIGIRNDIAEQVGLNFMTIQNVFPEPSADVIPLKDALIDLQYDDEEVKELTEKFTKTKHIGKTQVVRCRLILIKF